LSLSITLKGYVYREHLYNVRWRNSFTTTLPLEVFTQRNFVADFLSIELVHKNDKFVFSHPMGS